MTGITKLASAVRGMLLRWRCEMSTDSFVAAIFGDRLTVDPHLANDEASIHVVQNIYETPFVQAVDAGKGSVLTPSLSSVVPSHANGGLSSDSRQLTLRVRPKVSFHQGETLTPEDMRYSLVRTLTLADVRSPISCIAEFIWNPQIAADPVAKAGASAQVLDAITLTDTGVSIQLQRAFAPALAILANWLFILSKTWSAKQNDWDGTAEDFPRLKYIYRSGGLGFKSNGTGPYVLTSHRSDGETLKQNKEYWGRLAHFPVVEIRKVDDASERGRLLIEGEADFAVCSRETVPEVTESTDVQIYDGLDELNVNPFAAFNFDISTGRDNPLVGSGHLDGNGIPHDFFGDINVRRACTNAFAYDRFRNEGLGGRGRRAIGVIPSRLVPEAYTPELVAEAPQYDVAAARRHWSRAHGGALMELGCQFEIVTLARNPERIRAAQILAEGLNSIAPNVHVGVVELEWSDNLKAMRDHTAPLYWAGWQADYGDPHSLAFGLLHSRGPIAQEQRFSYPKFDTLIDSAILAADHAERASLYTELNRLSMTEVPQLYTFERDRFVILDPSVGGFEFNPFRASVFYYRDLYRRKGSKVRRPSHPIGEEFRTPGGAPVS